MKRCDNQSVGVVIKQRGKLLLLTRARPPVGVAPVAGHVDEHGTPDDAARAEVTEEVGLQVVKLVKVASGRRDNRCRRPGGSWHQWWIFRAEAVGRLRPDADETRGAGWYDHREVQRLADRTLAYARGEVEERDWRRDPGLEPVWCWWLAKLRIVRLGDGALRQVLALTTGPTR